MKKLNFVNLAKYVLIGVLVITVVGLALLGFLGFNTSTEYKGGYQVVIDAEEVIGNQADKIKDASVNAISNLGVKYTSLKQIADGRIVVFTVEK